MTGNRWIWYKLKTNSIAYFYTYWRESNAYLIFDGPHIPLSNFKRPLVNGRKSFFDKYVWVLHLFQKITDHNRITDKFIRLSKSVWRMSEMWYFYQEFTMNVCVCQCLWAKWMSVCGLILGTGSYVRCIWMPWSKWSFAHLVCSPMDSHNFQFTILIGICSSDFWYLLSVQFRDSFFYDCFFTDLLFLECHEE